MTLAGVKNIFLVFGYGIPKNIFRDENYNFYLKMVFNRIYDFAVENKDSRPLIICSGGRTDCFPPYRRMEGEEMVKFLKKLSQRPGLKQTTKDWSFMPENKSIFTLENFLGCQKLLKKKKINKANLFIFCEKTRAQRVRILAGKIFSVKYDLKIIPVDFDVSANRYLEPEFLAKKEQVILRYDLWALKRPGNFKKYHKFFKEKFQFLRKAGPKAHVKAVKEWWEKEILELKKIK